MNNNKKTIAPTGNGEKGNFTPYSHPEKSRVQREKLSAQSLVATNYVGDELARLRAARVEVQKIRLSIHHELELAKQTRAKAARYQQESEVKARSQAQLLILQARLATQKEIAEVKRKAGEEIQKALADIRMIRNTARDDLEAQQRFTDAVKIRALSLAFQEEARHESEREEEAVGV